jgi:hypothetical protein
MALILPMVALGLDMTRYAALNTQLQQAADAAALAAAMELNKTKAGLEAAKVAMNGAVANYQSVANDGRKDKHGPIEIVGYQFLWALPPKHTIWTDFSPYETKSHTNTHYIRVITEVRGIRSYFMGFVVGLLNRVQGDAIRDTRAHAISGITTVACKLTNLMMCNPVETTNGSCEDVQAGTVAPMGLRDFILAGGGDPSFARRLFKQKWVGANSQYGNGVFGLLESYGGKGKNAIRQDLASVVSPNCLVIGQGASTNAETGQGTAVVQGLNTRLGIYHGAMGGGDNRLLYPPAPNITKGHLPKVQNELDEFGVPTGNQFYEQDWCSKLEPADVPQDSDNDGTPDFDTHGHAVFPQDVDGNGLPDAFRLQRDSCLYLDDLCTAPITNTPGSLSVANSGRVGNGDWDIIYYLRVNHSNLVHDDGTPTGSLDKDKLNTVLQSIHSNNYSEYGIYADDDFTNTFPPPVVTQTNVGAPPVKVISVTNPPSRYAVYNYELALKDAGPTRIPGDIGPPSNALGSDDDDSDPVWPERGDPKDFPAECDDASWPGSPTRRNIFVAVVNCCEQHDAVNYGQREIRVDEVVELFLSEAAEQTGGGSKEAAAIFGEIIDARPVGPGEEQILVHEFVQLY